MNTTIGSVLAKVNKTGPMQALQETVVQKVWIAETAAGLNQYAPQTVQLTCVRESVLIGIPRDGGTREDVASDRLTFVGDVAIKLRDRIQFNDGTAGDVLRIKGATNPATGRPYAPEVLVGTRGGDA